MTDRLNLTLTPTTRRILDRLKARDEGFNASELFREALQNRLLGTPRSKPSTFEEALEALKQAQRDLNDLPYEERHRLTANISLNG